MDKYISECTIEALTLWPIKYSYSLTISVREIGVSMEPSSQSEMGEE